MNGRWKKTQRTKVEVEAGFPWETLGARGWSVWESICKSLPLAEFGRLHHSHSILTQQDLFQRPPILTVCTDGSGSTGTWSKVSIPVLLLSLLCINPILNSLGDPCPGCGVTFRSPAALAGHLNDSQNLCSFDTTNIRYPVPPALYSRPGEEVTGCYHPTSGYIYGKGDTLLEALRADEHERRREHVVHYPFADEGEWELAKFLARHLTQTAINEFLHLKWVRIISTSTISTTNHFG